MAGPLAIDTNSFQGLWHGSTPFQTYVDYPFDTIPGTSAGHIDWAVYAPGHFPAGFAGYTPAPLDYVYAYQVFVDEGDSQLLFFDVRLDLFGHNVGTFTGDGDFGLVSGDSPISSYLWPNDFVPTSANWDFGDSQPLFHSRGLVFSSPFRPQLLDGGIADFATDGSYQNFGFVIPLPSPFDLPEPSSFVLAALGLIGLVVWKRRR